jgi:hypothetical protein
MRRGVYASPIFGGGSEVQARAAFSIFRTSSRSSMRKLACPDAKPNGNPQGTFAETHEVLG